jgi:hypothetical protein
MLGNRLKEANRRAYHFLKRNRQWDEYCWLDERHIGIARKTRVRCSCFICSLSRKYHGKPLAEIKKDLELQEHE